MFSPAVTKTSLLFPTLPTTPWSCKIHYVIKPVQHTSMFKAVKMTKCDIVLISAEETVCRLSLELG